MNNDIRDKYEKISGQYPPYVEGVEGTMQETVQLLIMEAYLDGYKKGKKKYKRFKTKYLNLRIAVENAEAMSSADNIFQLMGEQYEIN